MISAYPTFQVRLRTTRALEEVASRLSHLLQIQFYTSSDIPLQEDETGMVAHSLGLQLNLIRWELESGGPAVFIFSGTLEPRLDPHLSETFKANSISSYMVEVLWALDSSEWYIPTLDEISAE